MLSKHKNTHILTALLVCGLALTALALNAGPIRWMKSAKTNAAPKASIKSILPSARSAAVTAPIIMFQGPGIAPTGDPGPGFDIEGSLQANTPNANTSDWVPGVAGTGVGVMNAAGVPTDPTKTFRAVDLFNSQSDDIFHGGLKFDDDPNTWTWVTGKPTGKDDVNNGLLHISTDSQGHLWFVVAGDRLSTNGDSFIDFEFLQNTLTKNANGTFTSAGPNGGRTVGDLGVTLELTQGGTQPEFFVLRWTGGQPTTSGFDYVGLTPANGTAFAAANIAGTVSVPYGAFGSTTYAMNSFAEAAIDITALISTLNPCIGIKTVLITTKTSQAPSATIKDFIAPIQLNLGTTPVASAGSDQASCAAASGPTSFTLNGTATNGTPAWSFVSSTGAIAQGDVSIVSPASATTNVNIANGKTGTVTLRLTVHSASCGDATDDVILTVNANAVADAGQDQTKCLSSNGTTVFTLNGLVSAGSSTPLWSFVSSTGGITSGDVTIVSPNSPTTNVNIANSKTGTVTLRLTSTVSCGTKTDDITLTVNPTPTANAGTDQVKCQAASGPTVFNLSGTANNGNPSWEFVSSTGTILQADVTIVSPNSATTAVNIAAGKIGTVTLNFVSTSGVACGTATDDILLTVNANPTATAPAAQTLCAAVSGTTNFSLTGSVSNGTPSWSFVSSTGTIVQADVNIASPASASTAVNIANGKTGTVTLRLTSTSASCGTATSDVVLTVKANPTATAGSNQTLCAAASGTTNFNLTGTVNNGTPSWSFVSSTGTIVQADVNIASPSSASTAVNIANGKTGTVTLRLTSTSVGSPSCGTATSDVVLTVNANPTATAGSNQTLCAAVSGTTNFNLTGSVTNGTPSWSFVSSTGTIVQADVNIASPSTASTAVNIANGKTGTVTLRLTSTSNASPSCGTKTSDVTLTVNPNPTANAGSAQSLCAAASGPTAFSLTGSVTNGTPSWSFVSSTGGIAQADVQIVSPSTASTGVNVANGKTGTVTLRLTSTSASCGTATSDVVLTVSATATANAGSPQTLCAAASGTTNFNLTGSVTGGAPSWSFFSSTGTIAQADVNIASPSSASTAVNIANGKTGTVTLRLTSTSASCGTATSNVTLTVNPNPTANAGSAQTLCQTIPGPTVFNLAGSVTNGTPSWSVQGTTGTASASIGSPNSANTTVSVTGVGTVTMLLNSVSATCGTATSNVVLTVNPVATVNAGPDQTVPACSTTQVQLAGSIGGGASSATWSTSGSGTFSPSATTLNAIYNPSQADLAAGSVTLTLTTNDPAGACGPASDTVVITFAACATCFKGPGDTIPDRSEISDQKAGSVLIYNLYTSSASAPSTQNTRINLTNVSPTQQIAVHLFFVDGATCTVADSYVCLTANQTTTFLTSDIDPGTSGYLIAVATDCETGCPIAFNCLIGDAYIKLSSGHTANLGAEAVAAVSATPSACDGNSVTTTLNFDGVSYNRLPRVLAADNVPSTNDGNDTFIVLNRIGGNLAISANTLSSLFGIFYNDSETAVSFMFSGGCQFRSSLSNNFPRITPRIGTFIPTGHSGWFKIWASSDATGGILGAMINFNPNSATQAEAYNQGHNLHKLTFTPNAQLTIPVFAPPCCR